MLGTCYAQYQETRIYGIYFYQLYHFIILQTFCFFKIAKPFIWNKSKKIYAYETNNVVLNCAASGMPKPEVNWYFEDKLLVKNQILALTANPVKYNYSAKNGSLSVLNLKLEDSGTYYCSATSIDKFPAAVINYTIKGIFNFEYYYFLIIVFIINFFNKINE